MYFNMLFLLFKTTKMIMNFSRNTWRPFLWRRLGQTVHLAHSLIGRCKRDHNLESTPRPTCRSQDRSTDFCHPRWTTATPGQCLLSTAFYSTWTCVWVNFVTTIDDIWRRGGSCPGGGGQTSGIPKDHIPALSYDIWQVNESRECISTPCPFFSSYPFLSPLSS